MAQKWGAQKWENYVEIEKDVFLKTLKFDTPLKPQCVELEPSL